MDDRLVSLFSKKLKISDSQLKTIYLEALREYTSSGNTLERTNYCFYKFVSGENSGKICGLLAKNKFVEAACEINGQYYCKSHYKTISERNRKSQTMKLTGIKKPFQISEDKIETERMGDYEVIKDTMLIIDRSKNCCLGKLVEGNTTKAITSTDEDFLNEKKIPYYRCNVTYDEDEKILEEKSEEILLNDLLS